MVKQKSKKQRVLKQLSREDVNKLNGFGKLEQLTELDIIKIPLVHYSGYEAEVLNNALVELAPKNSNAYQIGDFYSYQPSRGDYWGRFPVVFYRKRR